MIDFLKALFGSKSEEAPEGEAVELPVETVVVAGKQAPQERMRLGQRPGVTAVIMGEADDLHTLTEILEEAGDSPEQVLALAATLDVDAWLGERMDEDPGQFELPAAPWPSGAAQASELSVHLDPVTRRPKRHVIIGIFPTDKAWEVPAYVRYGGWNDCPETAVHVALHRRWYEAHGARIACLSGDVIECTVERPPATREAALALAREQFLYCPDLVHQGCESLEGLAATLLGNPVWYFWWD